MLCKQVQLFSGKCLGINQEDFCSVLGKVEEVVIDMRSPND